MSTQEKTPVEPTSEASGTAPSAPSAYIAPSQAASTPAASSDQQVFTLSPQLYNYGAVAILFLIVGMALGALVFGGNGGIDESTLRIAIREELAALDLSASAARPVDYMADDDPFLGPSDAPVTIVEFSDFLCSFCGRHYRETLNPLMEEYNGLVKYVYRDYIGVGGDYAYQSALAAECANDQGKFWDYHNLLFDNQAALASDSLQNTLIGFAGQLSLDVDSFTSCLTNETHRQDVILDRTDGDSVGMTGTPGFLINGQFLSGAQPIDVFRAVIDRELTKLGIDKDDPRPVPDAESTAEASSSS
ncbi:MAG: thioredoxin domain-containing protein [bacterium]|nr:thioredoxin domain-containing protein [bacterium]